MATNFYIDPQTGQFQFTAGPTGTVPSPVPTPLDLGADFAMLPMRSIVAGALVGLLLGRGTGDGGMYAVAGAAAGYFFHPLG